MALEIIWDDITKVKADAIVTPASRHPRKGSGLDGVIHNAAGKELTAWRRKLGPIGPGIVYVTPSYGLSGPTGAKHILHALGPAWNDNPSDNTEFVLDDTYLRILLKAKSLGCNVLSVPVLSSGKFGMPMDKALDAAVRAITAFLEAFPGMTVKLVGIDTEFRSIARLKYGEYCVSSSFTKEEETAYRSTHARAMRSTQSTFGLSEKLDYFKRLVFHQIMDGTTFKEAFRKIWCLILDSPTGQNDEVVEPNGPKRIRNIPDLARESGIEEKTIKNYINRNAGSSTTGKDKIVALCVALRLPLDFAVALLEKSSLGFDKQDKRDMLIAEFIGKRSGKIADLRALLAENGFADLKTTGRERRTRGSR